MSIFKRIFNRLGTIEKNSGNDEPDLEKLISSDNINSSIIELDNYICKICKWGDDLDKLTEEQKLFFFNQNLEREVNNGGFNQFFNNSSGNFSHETISSLISIKAFKTVEILKEAIAQFPNNQVPKDFDDRIEIITQIEEKANPIWEQLDQEFFKYTDNLNHLNMEFIKQHRTNFE